MSDTYIGVVDRIVDEKTAVILLEKDGEVVEQLDLAVDRLPEDGQHGGAVLEVKLKDGAFSEASYLPDWTEDRSESARERLDRLSRPLSEEDSRDQ